MSENGEHTGLPVRRAFLLMLLCAAAAPAWAKPRKPRRPRLPAGLVIASIVVETHNVFDTSGPPENKLLYRAADAIHIQTRDPVIARELLFAVGDPYDGALIEESERNLRALPFVRRAEITAAVNGKGGVDVTVRTYDSWTLEVVASFKRAGGVTSVKAGLAEHNILGEGKGGSAVYSRDGTSESKAFGYQDRQFLHYQRLRFAILALSAPGSKKLSLDVTRPFYASIAPSAFGVVAAYDESRASTFDGDTSVGTVSRNTAEAGFDFGVALATSTERTRRVKMGLLAHRADYKPIPGEASGPMPDREQAAILKFGGEWEELDFLTVRRIQKFTQDEDYNLGLGVFPAVEWAPYVRVLGTTGTRIRPSIAVRKGFPWTNQLLFLRTGYKSQYANGGNGNRVASFDVTYYARGLKYQTLAFHTGLDLGWHLIPGDRLGLGEVNGLRGYGLSQFSGSRRFLFNAEDRVYVWDDLFRILDVGAVLFFDSGYAWPASNAVRLGDLKSSVGLGLRLAPSRSSGNSPVRIDLARALSDNGTRSRWSLSILAGQAFE